MTPVVICHVTIVLLNGRKPSTQDSVVDVKTTGEIKVDEHSKGCLEQKKNFYSCVIFGQKKKLFRVLFVNSGYSYVLMKRESLILTCSVSQSFNPKSSNVNE